ncbi:MAG TPA: hypothetical protein DCR97_07085 [Deltaproteobacteria bacterium]|nr:hypothetical protein [Deltaproteobacteria bacterium]
MTRGGVILGYARYIKKKWGKDGLEQCQRAVGMPNAKILEDGWYPEKVNCDVLHWIADNHGRDEVFKAAVYTVNGNGVIAFAARMAGIRNVLDRGVEDYRRNFNFGEIKVNVGDGRATITLTDSPFDELDCYSWQGAFQGVLDMCKLRGKVEQTECTFKGGKSCVYEMTWDK